MSTSASDDRPACSCLPYVAGGSGPDIDCPIHGIAAQCGHRQAMFAIDTLPRNVSGEDHYLAVDYALSEARRLIGEGCSCYPAPERRLMPTSGPASDDTGTRPCGCEWDGRNHGCTDQHTSVRAPSGGEREDRDALIERIMCVIQDRFFEVAAETQGEPGVEPRTYSVEHYWDTAEMIVDRALSATPVSTEETIKPVEHVCPTPCDPDCPALCHETHKPRWKWEHTPPIARSVSTEGPGLVEEIAQRLEVHQLEWIDREVGYSCGCDERGTLPPMLTLHEALLHVASACFASRSVSAVPADSALQDRIDAALHLCNAALSNKYREPGTVAFVDAAAVYALLAVPVTEPEEER